MLNIQDFAASIKAKHPQYGEMDDTDLVNKIIEKYPQYKEKVNLEDGKEGMSSHSKGREHLKKMYAANPFLQAGVGVAKDIGRTILGASKLAKGALDITAEAAVGLAGRELKPGFKAKSLEEITGVTQEDLAPTTAFEKVGAAASQIAQFLLPTKGLTSIQKAPKIMQAIGAIKGTFAPVKQFLLKGAFRAGVEGVADATIATVRAGEVGQETLVAGALGAAARPVTGVLGAAARPVSKEIKKFIKGAKPNELVFRALKPSAKKGRTLAKITSSVEEANKIIVDQGHVPTDISSYANSIRESKRAIWDQIEEKLATNVDSQVDFTDISRQVREMSESQALKRANPKAIKEIQDYADTLIAAGETDSILVAEETKQMINNEVGGLFGEIQLSKPMLEAKKLVSRLIGEQQDKILSKVPGEFQTLKNQYGALSEIYPDILRREIALEKANPESLFSGLGKLAGVGDIAKGVLSASPGQIAKGATELATGRLLKQASDANEMIRAAFEKFLEPEAVQNTGVLRDITKPIGQAIRKVTQPIKERIFGSPEL